MDAGSWTHQVPRGIGAWHHPLLHQAAEEAGGDDAGQGSPGTIDIYGYLWMIGVRSVVITWYYHDITCNYLSEQQVSCLYGFSYREPPRWKLEPGLALKIVVATASTLARCTRWSVTPSTPSSSSRWATGVERCGWRSWKAQLKLWGPSWAILRPTERTWTKHELT